MRMRVDKSGQNHFAGAVDLDDLAAISLEPSVAQRVLGGADGDDFSAQAQHRAVLNDAKLFQVRPATRAKLSASRCVA